MGKQTAVPGLETRIKLYRDAKGNHELLGFAELVIGGAFVIRNIRIVRAKGEDGELGDPFISFPSRKGTGENESKYFDIAHPITAEAHRTASEAILKAYNAAAKL